MHQKNKLIIKMKRYKFIYLIALMAAGFCSCRNQEVAEEYTIKMDEAEKTFKLADILEPLKFTAIQSPDSCLMKNLDKVIQIPDGYVILDRANEHSVVAYSEAGQFICTFGRKGGGPGEYTFVHDIALSPNRDSLLVCGDNSDVYIYSLDGVFGRKLQASEKVPLSHITTNSDNIVMCASDIMKGFDQFYLYSPKMDIKFAGIPSSGHFTIPTCNEIWASNNSVYYLDWYANKLYEINTADNHISKTWEFDIPNNVASQNYSDMMSFLMNQREVGFIMNWAIGNDKFIGEYILDGEQLIILYDLHANSLVKQGKYNDILPDLFPAIADNNFIAVINADNYEIYKERLPQGVELPVLDDEKTDVILMLWQLKTN